MQKLEVLIEENAFGSVRPVELVADAPVSALVPALVEELHLPLTDLYGKKLVYQLRQANGGPGGEVFPWNATLLACGVQQGARLLLDSYVEDEVAVGSLAAPAPPPPRAYADPALYSSATLTDADVFGQGGGASTSIPLPAVRRTGRKKSRRAFLLLGGAALGLGGIGFAYARYPGLASEAFNRIVAGINQGGAHQTGQANRTVPVPAQPVLPTGARTVQVFTQHRQIVRTVSWSPDGTLLASGADDALAYVWDTEGNIRLHMQHPGPVNALAWSADSHRLVSGSNTQVLFFNALTGAVFGRSTHRHMKAVTGVAWTPHHQQQVITGGADMRLVVWDTQAYQAQHTFLLHTTPISAVSWSADGQTAASASLGGVARVWDAATGREVHGYYEDGNVPLRAMAFAPQGMSLAVGGNDGIVRIWNGLNCQQQGKGQFGIQCLVAPQRLQASHTPVRSLSWSPDARFLAVGTDDGNLTVWYPTQGQHPLFTVKQQNAVRSITWSPDGKQFASGAGTVVTLWRLMS